MEGFHLPQTQITESATGGVLKNNVFFAISQKPQENTCTRVSFLIKLQVSVPERRDFDTGVFIGILWSF